MKLSGKTIGFAITGSHCTIAEVIPQMARLVHEGGTLVPVFSESVSHTDTRFGTAQEWRLRVFGVAGREPLETIADVEQFGPKQLLDALVIAPCTGNTLAKLARGITDSVVTMAAKAHLRNRRPLIVAISTNDGLGANAPNIGELLNRKHVYLVPFGQDSPEGKANSLVADMSLILETVLAALNGEQLEPLLLSRAH